MVGRQLFATTLIVALLGIASARADEIRYYEQNGVTYRETRQVVQRPVYETRVQPTTRTVYREQLTAECRNTTRTVWTPVTQYRYETYLVGRWNPLVDPHYVAYWVPETRWQQRMESVKTPVVCRRWVPQNETVQMPVITQRTVSQEVVSRVAVSRAVPLASTSSPSPTPAWPATPGATWPQTPPPAPTEQIGGLARLSQDPPRYGVNTAWRASSSPIR